MLDFWSLLYRREQEKKDLPEIKQGCMKQWRSTVVQIHTFSLLSNLISWLYSYNIWPVLTAGIGGSLDTASEQWVDFRFLSSSQSLVPLGLSLLYHFVQQTVGDSRWLYSCSLLYLLINHVSCCSPDKPRHNPGLSIYWFSTNLPRLLFQRKGSQSPLPVGLSLSNHSVQHPEAGHFKSHR